MKLCVSVALGCPGTLHPDGPWLPHLNLMRESRRVSLSVRDAVTLNVGFGSLSVDSALETLQLSVMYFMMAG